MLEQKARLFEQKVRLLTEKLRLPGVKPDEF
jgi:hypothetical protein